MKNIFIIMGFLSSFLSSFGCSGQNRNRLTEKIIDKTPDENLIELIYDNLSGKIGNNYENEFKIVSNWNESQQAIYIIWKLETEVNNGGFNQFYFNSSGQFYKMTPNALKLIGSNKFYDLIVKANKTYETENEKITKYQDGTLDGFSKSYIDNPLNEFDDEFQKTYDLENLYDLQTNYIRKNKLDFIDK